MQLKGDGLCKILQNLHVDQQTYDGWPAVHCSRRKKRQRKVVLRFLAIQSSSMMSKKKHRNLGEYQELIEAQMWRREVDVVNMEIGALWAVAPKPRGWLQKVSGISKFFVQRTVETWQTQYMEQDSQDFTPIVENSGLVKEKKCGRKGRWGIFYVIMWHLF